MWKRVFSILISIIVSLSVFSGVHFFAVANTSDLTYEQYEELKTTADFVSQYKYERRGENLLGDIQRYYCEKFPQYIFYEYFDNPDEMATSRGCYAVVPLKSFKKVFYRELKAPKGFFEEYVMQEAFPVEAATKDGVKTTIYLGYDGASGTYGVYGTDVSETRSVEYDGYIDNGDGTYSFYFAVLDVSVRLDYGYVVTLKPESDGIALVSDGEEEKLPTEYYINYPPLSYEQFKRLRATSDYLLDYYKNGVSYYYIGMYLKEFYPDQVTVYRKGVENGNGEIALTNQEYYVVPSALLDEVYYDIFPDAPSGFYYVVRSDIRAAGERITAYTASGSPIEIKLGYDRRLETYAWEMNKPDESPICEYVGCSTYGWSDYTFYYHMLKEGGAIYYITVGLGAGDSVYYQNRDYVSKLPDVLFDPPKSAPLRFDEFRSARAAADYLCEYCFGADALHYKYAGFLDEGDESYVFCYSNTDINNGNDNYAGTYVVLGIDGEIVVAIDAGYLLSLPEEFTEPPRSIMGDADEDGDITVADALAALRVAAKLAESSHILVAYCDTDGDREVTVADALAILRVAAKLTDVDSL